MDQLRHLDFGHGDAPVVRLSLDEVASLIRALYCAEYRRMSPASADYGERRIPRWDGGEDQNTGRMYEPVWPRIARFLVTRNIDPASYISAQFAHRRGLAPPAPNTLMSTAALERYTTGQKHELPILRAEWARQHTALEMRVAELRRFYTQATETQIYVTAIHDQKLVDVSSLFRYCAAMRYGLPHVAERYVKAALTQYIVQASQYDAIARDEIPEALRTDAAAVLQAFTTGKDGYRGV